MFGKSVYLLTFLVAIVVVVNSVPLDRYASHNASLLVNLIEGTRVPGDRLILQHAIDKSSSWNQIVTVQQVFSVNKEEKITQFKVLDQKYDGNGATVTRVSGGLGTSNVTLLFQSIEGRDINFIVELYARGYILKDQYS